jgi:hypothetical protein
MPVFNPNDTPQPNTKPLSFEIDFGLELTPPGTAKSGIFIYLNL